MESFLASQSLHQQNNNQHIIHYNSCPVCSSKNISHVLTAKDHTVSKENFEVWHCNHCTLRFTQNIPDIHNIGPYYQSIAYVSHSDTQEGLINKLYHIVRNYTLQSKRKLVQSATELATGSLLDVGAGTGAFASIMQTAGWNVTGLEPDDTARKNALEKHQLQLQSPDNLYQLPANQFDAITMWHVLEHVHDLQGYMDTYHRILKQNGKLVIAVPNYTSYDAAAYQENWAAYDVPRHLYHFSPKSIDELAKLKGFTVQQYQPMWFDSFYVAMLSEQCKTGKNNLIAAVWNGLISNLKTLFDKKKCSSVIYVLTKA
jgi:2-polyprenyl-3-methyl-5-hydroxy-6-metoxy-1,4-benzoquinol methylase